MSNFMMYILYLSKITFLKEDKKLALIYIVNKIKYGTFVYIL